MINILDQIISRKKQEVAERKQSVPIPQLEAASLFRKPVVSMKQHLLSKDSSGIIAEFKRKSPSRGFIHENADPGAITRGYVDAGAAGLSVLTDTDYFGGSNSDLLEARLNEQVPILRKDFIIEEYQLVEARALGADVILLIAAALAPIALKELARFARSLEMQVLLEVHDQEELDHLNPFVDMVGVNNRDLKTFKTDINRSVALYEHLPEDLVKISESGINDARDMKMLRQAGYDGFLIGDLFMRSADPANALHHFIKESRL